MLIHDRMVTVIQHKVDTPSIIRGWFPEWNGDGNVICPFHGDSNPSLHISPDGKANCFGCGFFARSIADLYARMEKMSYKEARQILYRLAVNAIPMTRVDKFSDNLHRSRSAMTYLMKKRNLDRGTIRNYNLGLDPYTRRISIPIIDEFNTCVNIRLIAWEGKSKHKAINQKGHGEVRLFPEWLIYKEKKLLLCEGEFDCLVARSFGLPAVTWTGGSGGMNKDHLHFFAGKMVYLLYDNDDAGEKGKWLMLETLRSLAWVVKVIDPLDTAGKDITDWSFSKPKRIETLKTFIDAQVAPTTAIDRYCPTCGRLME